MAHHGRRPCWHALLPACALRLLLALAFALPSHAVFVNFDNCLDPAVRNSNPLQLQFVPFHFWAAFNATAPSHNLNISIYGNVSGQATEGVYPPPGDPSWADANNTFGKIVDVSPTNLMYSTLFSTYKVLTYTPYSAPASAFCLSTVNTSCPIAPAFHANASDPYSLPAFSVAHDFFSTYSFATLSITVRVDSGDAGAPHIACVSGNITPDLGSKLSNALTYLPAAILSLVAIATVFAATYSPWGTTDPFRWTSNYGRDEDLLRLVTPGFADCLQYIQFIVLAGSLNLAYPGFYQPVISRASWSVLLFGESLVSHGNRPSLVDGIYFTNGTYGLSRLGQLAGVAQPEDVWAGMAAWLVGIAALVVFLGQLGFCVRWAYRELSNHTESDLRSKNWPFAAGNVVRILFNFFLLPILALSLFQLVVAPHSPAVVVAMAVVVLLAVFVLAVWIFWFIFTTRPRAHLFDDLPTVLAYGPLYNTYSDDAAPFACIPVLVTCLRGIAIGAIQPSGIAQLILLAISEVVLILTVHAFRPFQSNTSMNAYHTFFAVVRLLSTLLMIAFVPSLGISEAGKGWTGYTVLLLHAIVLVFGFFLNSLQTLIEVAARLAGAGGEERGGLVKVFGMRQLARRTHRRGQRSSLASDAAMLAHEGDSKSIQLMASRARSMSGSSAVLLNQGHGTGSQRASFGWDQNSQEHSTAPGTPGTPGTTSLHSRRPTMGTPIDHSDPYYRPPRQRRATMDPGRKRGSGSSLDPALYADLEQAEAGDAGEGPSSMLNRNSMTPAYLRVERDDPDPTPERRQHTDYTVRESDFYYGIRGPALSNQPTRKLKTGPADPMGPVASATGWFRDLFGGKRKEKGKGFEVVRSTRMPPMVPPEEGQGVPLRDTHHEPYRDEPTRDGDRVRTREADAEAGAAVPGLADGNSRRRVSNKAPTLDPIEAEGGIGLPSRLGSTASSQPEARRAPTLPRRSSKRTKSVDKLSTVASVPSTPGRPMSSQRTSEHLEPGRIRLPFGSAGDPSPERSPGQSTISSLYPSNEATGGELTVPTMTEAGGERPMSTGFVHQHWAHESIRDDGVAAGNQLESAAELVDGRSLGSQRSGTSQRSRQR